MNRWRTTGNHRSSVPEIIKWDERLRRFNDRRDAITRGNRCCGGQRVDFKRPSEELPRRRNSRGSVRVDDGGKMRAVFFLLLEIAVEVPELRENIVARVHAVFERPAFPREREIKQIHCKSDN